MNPFGRTVNILIVFTLFLLGCGESNRYEMTKDANGRTVRLDKKTGEVAVIENNQIAVLKNHKEVEQEAKKTSLLEAPKVWPVFDVPQLGGLKAILTTVWRDDRLAYRFSVYPFTKKLETQLKKPFSTFGLKIGLYDDNGFKVTEIILPIVRLSQNVDDKGEVLGLSANDGIPLSSSSYTQISTWNIMWYGE